MIRVCLLFLLVAIFGLFIQAVAIHSAFPAAIAPDLILILVVLLALQYRNVAGVLGAFVLGLLADFASGQYVGPNAAGNIVAFGVVGIIVSRVYADRSLALVFVTFVACLAKSSVFLAMCLIYLENAVGELLQLNVLKLMLLEALISAALAPLLLRLFFWSERIPKGHRSSANPAFRWWQDGR